MRARRRQRMALPYPKRGGRNYWDGAFGFSAVGDSGDA
jgi:hypothetical protein